MSKKIQVCRGAHCRYRGSERIMEVLEEHYQLKSGERNDKVDLGFCLCTDNCDWGPNVVENDTRVYRGAKTKDIAKRVDIGKSEPLLPLDLDNVKIDELV